VKTPPVIHRFRSEQGFTITEILVAMVLLGLALFLAIKFLNVLHTPRFAERSQAVQVTANVMESTLTELRSGTAPQALPSRFDYAPESKWHLQRRITTDGQLATVVIRTYRDTSANPLATLSTAISLPVDSVRKEEKN